MDSGACSGGVGVRNAIRQRDARPAYSNFSRISAVGSSLTSALSLSEVTEKLVANYLEDKITSYSAERSFRRQARLNHVHSA